MSRGRRQYKTRLAVAKMPSGIGSGACAAWVTSTYSVLQIRAWHLTRSGLHRGRTATARSGSHLSRASRVPGIGQAWQGFNLPMAEGKCPKRSSVLHILAGIYYVLHYTALHYYTTSMDCKYTTLSTLKYTTYQSGCPPPRCSVGNEQLTFWFHKLDLNG